jgi:hypothetical protein
MNRFISFDFAAKPQNQTKKTTFLAAAGENIANVLND